MSELACVNGVFSALSDARVSVEDRGFQFGDGVYEVLVFYDGKPFLLDRHLERLQRSAQGIDLEYDVSAVEPLIHEGVRRTGLRDAMVYVQLTRGPAPRSHVFPKQVQPTVVLTFKPLPELPEDLRRRGLKVRAVPDNRWAECHIKAITLLPNVLAKNRAIATGFDDAIFVGPDGSVREGTSSNLFAVKSGALLLPPRNRSILHGITQGFLIECAEEINVPIREERLSLDSLLGSDEVLLCSTLTEVVGVVQIDDRIIGSGQVGPLTQALLAEFRRRSRKSTSSRSAPAVA